MTDHLAPSRRTVLIAGVGVLTLAACGSSGGDDPESTATRSPAAGGGTNSTTTVATDPTSAAPSAPATSEDSGAPSDDQALVELERVPVGGAVSVQLANGRPGIVARPDANSAVAFSAICTHQACTVAPDGNELRCPCHGSVYNAFTGAVISGPAPAPLPEVGVQIVDGEVVPS
jgi:cytochrome b6-f complex iron-sulfur subunit